MKNSIKEQIATLDWNNYDSVIELHENNSLYFNNYNLTSDEETIIELIEIKLYYCDALNNNKKFKKSLTILRDIDILLQKIKTNTEAFNKYYIQAQFVEGVSLAWLKRPEEAYQIFKELLKKDPDNDIYKEWYIDSKSNSQRKLLSIISKIGLGVIVLEILGNITGYYKMDKNIQIIAWLMIITGWIFPGIRKYWIKFKEKL